MKDAHTKPSRLSVWGDSLLNKLSGRSRKNRKREASKKRRIVLERESREAASAGSPGPPVYSAGPCPVCAGFGGLFFVKAAFTGRVFLLSPCCGTAWRSIPPEDSIEEVQTPDSVAPTGVELATMADLREAGVAHLVAEQAAYSQWEHMLSEFLTA